MITEKEAEAKIERNDYIGLELTIGSLIIFSAIYGYMSAYISLTTSFLIFICSFVFIKIAYDAYTIPLLYIEQHIALKKSYEKQSAELKKQHKISKYNTWRL